MEDVNFSISSKNFSKKGMEDVNFSISSKNSSKKNEETSEDDMLQEPVCQALILKRGLNIIEENSQNYDKLPYESWLSLHSLSDGCSMSDTKRCLAFILGSRHEVTQNNVLFASISTSCVLIFRNFAELQSFLMPTNAPFPFLFSLDFYQSPFYRTEKIRFACKLRRLNKKFINFILIAPNEGEFNDSPQTRLELEAFVDKWSSKFSSMLLGVICVNFRVFNGVEWPYLSLVDASKSLLKISNVCLPVILICNDSEKWKNKGELRLVSSVNGDSKPIYNHCIAQYGSTKVSSQRYIDEDVFLKFSREMFYEVPTKKNLKLALDELLENSCFVSCFSKTLPDFLVGEDASCDVQHDVERMLHILLNMDLQVSSEILRLDIFKKLIVTSALFPLPDSYEFVDLLHTNLLSNKVNRREFLNFYKKLTEFYMFLTKLDDDSENECEVCQDDEEFD